MKIQLPSTAPFNLELAKAGFPLIDGVGRSVRLLCHDRSGSKYPLVGIRTFANGNTDVQSWTDAGSLGLACMCSSDLLLDLRDTPAYRAAIEQEWRRNRKYVEYIGRTYGGRNESGAPVVCIRWDAFFYYPAALRPLFDALPYVEPAPATPSRNQLQLQLRALEVLAQELATRLKELAL